jgi:hypothetical protein
VNLHWWLVERQYGWIDWPITRRLHGRTVDAITDRQWRWVEQPAMRAWCRWRGHQLIPDQCGIPDHDYCARCGASPGRREGRDGR